MTVSAPLGMYTTPWYSSAFPSPPHEAEVAHAPRCAVHASFNWETLSFVIWFSVE